MAIVNYFYNGRRVEMDDEFYPSATLHSTKLLTLAGEDYMDRKLPVATVFRMEKKLSRQM